MPWVAVITSTDTLDSATATISPSTGMTRMKSSIKDNDVEPEPAKFPGIPAEMPGVERERDNANLPIAAVVEDPSPTEEELIDAAIENANFGPREARVVQHSRPTGVGDHQNGQEIVINVDVVPAQEGEIEEPRDDDDDEAPDLYNAADSSDDESYAPEHESDVELEDFEEEPLEDDNEQDEDGTAPRRSNRSRAPVQQFVPNQRSYMHASVSEKPRIQLLNPNMFHPMAVRQFGMKTPSTPVNEVPQDDIDKPFEIRSDEVEVLGVIMAQMSLREGIRLFGERAKDGATKEMRQLHDMKTFFPREAKSLTREERIKALSSLIFLKEKNNGDIKGRTCINGAPQREYIRKEDAASPTVATDSIFITGAIDAHEKRHVASCDLPGAFLHTVTDEKVIMVLRGELCELMVKVDPKLYRKYVTKDRKGKPLLYVQLYKSLYGLMRSALLFYRKLRGELEAYGFKINPYDGCVANKETPGGQLTVLWHVDDLKMSCKDNYELTKLLLYLKNIYGEKNFAFTRGKQHEYLGMDLDYGEAGVFKVSMVPYIDKVHEDFPEAIEKSAPAPHNDYLFKIRAEDEAVYLPEEQAVLFHHSVAQLLFLACRARRDIQVSVAFLTTRVRRPDEDDWGKLRRVLQYLKGIQSPPLRLTIDTLSHSKWFIDASHNVHWDCKGHTGASMTLGEGAVMCSSKK